MAKKSTSTSVPRGSAAPKTAAAKKAATPAPAAAAPATAAKAKKSAQPTTEQIATRAFQIWERKGKPVGQDAQNWAQAEQELLAGK